MAPLPTMPMRIFRVLTRAIPSVEDVRARRRHNANGGANQCHVPRTVAAGSICGGGVDAKRLWEEYPRLFHMAEAGSWPSIRKHGLLSTSALLDLFEISGRERTRVESQHRPESVTISHPKHGRAIIRDQKPMSGTALRRCLIGMMPQAWYELVNRRVYFWLVEERLNRLLMAKMYRNVEHVVLTIDTRSLVTAHEDEIRLSPINTGSTIRN